MSKKIRMAVLCVSMLLIIGITYFIHTNATYGTSDDGLWRGVAKTEFFEKQTWSAYLYYTGKNPPDSIIIERTIDGVKDTPFDVTPEIYRYTIFLPLDILIFKTFPVHVYCVMILKKSDTPPDISVSVTWDENGISKTSEIYLK